MRITLTNTQPVDITVDTVGQNNPMDKRIIHPKTTVNLEVTSEAFKKLPKIGVIVKTLRGE